MKNRKWWSFSNMSEDEGNNGEELNIRVYGEIVSVACFEGEVSANSFQNELDKHPDAKTIKVHINSPGGDVFEAQTIYNALRKHSASVEVHIDALAASAATLIASAGDKVFMPTNALYMIHNPASWAAGEAKDMRKMADTLDTVRDTIIPVYQSKSTLSTEEIVELMDNETFMTAKDAKENGFITDVVEIEITKESAEEVQNFMRGQIINNYKNSIPTGLFKNIFKNKSKGISNFANTNKGDEVMKKDEFIKNHSELYNQIVNEAKEEERGRIKNIDDLQNKEGFEDIVNSAKYENIENAGDVALKIMNSAKFKAKEEMGKREEDFKNSGVANVDTNSEEDEEDKVFNTVMEGIKQRYNKK